MMGNKNSKADAVHLEDRGTNESSRLDSQPGCEAHRSLIPIVVYYKEQRRGFANSGELNDWLSDERKHDTAD